MGRAMGGATRPEGEFEEGEDCLHPMVPGATGDLFARVPWVETPSYRHAIAQR